MKKQCPVCKKIYETILKEPINDNRNIQEIYPNALAYQREQLITGICSDECWDKLTKVNND